MTLYVPENAKIESLQYGSHWSVPGKSGWYVRMDGGPWVQARSTPASDELPSDYDEVYWATAESLAAEYIEAHADDSQHDADELTEAFRGMFRREPDADDIEQGLWSLLCA